MALFAAWTLKIPCYLFFKISDKQKLREAIMASNVFGAKQFKPTAPDKGSFPLDHEGTLVAAAVKLQ